MRYKSIELRKKELYKDNFRDPSYDRTIKSLKTGSSHIDTSKNESLNTHQSHVSGSNQLTFNQNYNQKINTRKNKVNKVSNLNQSITINMPERIQIQDLKQNTTNNS
jgi:hypothetical protein